MYAISIDSGGTKVVGAVVDGDGNILTKKRYDIPERDGNFLIATFRDIISQYSGEYPISVVGIGGNGRIDPVEGVILNCGVHANWQGRHLRKELEDDFHIPVSVNNDCYCAIKGGRGPPGHTRWWWESSSVPAWGAPWSPTALSGMGRSSAPVKSAI